MTFDDLTEFDIGRQVNAVLSFKNDGVVVARTPVVLEVRFVNDRYCMYDGNADECIFPEDIHDYEFIDIR